MKLSILKWLIDNGNDSIVNIALGLGFSVPTVNKYLKELVEEGLVKDYGKEESARGRKPMIYGANPESCYFVGVDIKPYALSMMMMNLVGTTISEVEEPDGFVFENTPRMMDFICDRVKEFINGFPNYADKVKLISFNLMGRVNADIGYSYTILNFEDSQTPLSEILSGKIGIPCVIENDTRAMTCGEYAAGSLGKYKNALFVNFSWGIGLGMILDGKLYSGANGYSGEIGHMYTYDNNIMCHCGKLGCLETEVSISAIARHIREEILSGKPSLLADAVRSGKTITPAVLSDAINREDPLALEIVEKTGNELGRHLANLINIFNPEGVVIGGAQSIQSEFFLDSVRHSITRYSLRLMYRDVEVCGSDLKDSAGVIGACHNARNRYFKAIMAK